MYRLVFCIGLLINALISYSQEEYEYVNTSSWAWSDNSELSWYSSSINKLDVFYNKAKTEENKKNNTWSSATTWLNIPVIKGRAYTITIDVKNENDPKNFKYKVLGKDKYGRSVEEWHSGDIYWGIIFKLTKTSGGENDFELYYCNEKTMNSNFTYTSYKTSMTTGWKSCSNLATRTIKVVYDGDDWIKIYEGNGNNLIYTNYTTHGLSYIGIKCGNAARVCVTNFKMYRQTEFGLAISETLKASQLIEKKDYITAIGKLTQVINTYKDPLPYYYRARAYIGQEYYKSAIEDCNSALQYQCETELRNDIYFLRGFSKIMLKDDSGVADMRQAGTLGMTFLRENNLLDYVPSQSNKQSSRSSSSSSNSKTKNRTMNRSSNHVPILKKTK